MVLTAFMANAQNLLINGDFEAGTLAPWWVFVDAAAAAADVDSSGGSVNYAEITNPGTHTYDIQLIQELSEDQLTELGGHINETYYLSFDAIVPETRPCNLFFGEIGGSWTNLANGIVYSFTAEQTTYTASIKITQVFDAMKFGLEIGTSDVPVEFDNIVLTLTPPAEAIEQPLSRNYFVFPNPAVDILHVNAGNGDQVSLYSITGLMIGSKRVLDTSVAFDLRDLVPGVYLIKIQSGDTQITEKIFIR